MNRIQAHKERLLSLRPRAPRQKTRRTLPDGALQTCPLCRTTLPDTEIAAHLQVCPVCGFHFKVGAWERIEQIADPRSFHELFARIGTENIGQFAGYDEKLEQARKTTGLKEAVVCGTGTIHGHRVALAVMDARFMMASMGRAVGEKLTRLIEYAGRHRLPLILFAASGGARMQEGIYSLMQMAKTSSALKAFSDRGLLSVCVLTNPTTGGVSASFAMLTDLLLAEPGALIGFAGRRVIENTIHEKLPDNFQKAEFMLARGFVDRIVARRNLRRELGLLLSLHQT